MSRTFSISAAVVGVGVGHEPAPRRAGAPAPVGSPSEASPHASPSSTLGPQRRRGVGGQQLLGSPVGLQRSGRVARPPSAGSCPRRHPREPRCCGAEPAARAPPTTRARTRRGGPSQARISASSRRGSASSGVAAHRFGPERRGLGSAPSDRACRRPGASGVRRGRRARRAAGGARRRRPRRRVPAGRRPPRRARPARGVRSGSGRSARAASASSACRNREPARGAADQAGVEHLALGVVGAVQPQRGDLRGARAAPRRGEGLGELPAPGGNARARRAPWPAGSTAARCCRPPAPARSPRPAAGCRRRQRMTRATSASSRCRPRCARPRQLGVAQRAEVDLGDLDARGRSGRRPGRRPRAARGGRGGSARTGTGAAHRRPMWVPSACWPGPPGGRPRRRAAPAGPRAPTRPGAGPRRTIRSRSSSGAATGAGTRAAEGGARSGASRPSSAGQRAVSGRRGHDPHQLAGQLLPHRQRRLAADVHAGADRDPGAGVVGARGQLGDQPGLADTALAGDEHDAAAALPGGGPRAVRSPAPRAGRTAGAAGGPRRAGGPLGPAQLGESRAGGRSGADAELVVQARRPARRPTSSAPARSPVAARRRSRAQCAGSSSGVSAHRRGDQRAAAAGVARRLGVVGEPVEQRDSPLAVLARAPDHPVVRPVGEQLAPQSAQRGGSPRSERGRPRRRRPDPSGASPTRRGWRARRRRRAPCAAPTRPCAGSPAAGGAVGPEPGGEGVAVVRAGVQREEREQAPDRAGSEDVVPSRSP